VKKTFPALLSLYAQNLMPKNLHVVGYARTKINHDEFIKKISSKFPSTIDKKKVEEFLSLCSYISGQYDKVEDFKRLDEHLRKLESNFRKANRIFYFAIPPNVFVDVARGVHAGAMSTTGSNKIIVEKPFGKDLESSNKLVKEIGEIWAEDQIYRIDHYLGKEMVQNLMVLRFANKVFEPIWNRYHVSCVLITFKENFGTQGRGGYFVGTHIYVSSLNQSCTCIN
jgi:glucose-6-phosphate 1-dehydrogenase